MIMIKPMRIRSQILHNGMRIRRTMLGIFIKVISLQRV